MGDILCDEKSKNPGYELIFVGLLLNCICEWFKKESILSDCENLAEDRKLLCNCWSGLLFDGLKPLNVGLVAPGMFTGVELPNKPADASPTEIEFVTVGDSTSNSLSSDVKVKSSRFSSSKALPKQHTFECNYSLCTH